jgi:hypothetical protein
MTCVEGSVQINADKLGIGNYKVLIQATIKELMYFETKTKYQFIRVKCTNTTYSLFNKLYLSHFTRKYTNQTSDIA